MAEQFTDIKFELDRYEDSPKGCMAVLYLTADRSIKLDLPAHLLSGSTCMNFKLIEDPATTEEEKALIEEVLSHLREK